MSHGAPSFALQGNTWQVELAAGSRLLLRHSLPHWASRVRPTWILLRLLHRSQLPGRCLLVLDMGPLAEQHDVFPPLRNDPWRRSPLHGDQGRGGLLPVERQGQRAWWGPLGAWAVLSIKRGRATNCRVERHQRGYVPVLPALSVQAYQPGAQGGQLPNAGQNPTPASRMVSIEKTQNKLICKLSLKISREHDIFTGAKIDPARGGGGAISSRLPRTWGNVHALQL